MPFADFAKSQNIQIFHYQDIDHFKQGLRGAHVDIVPLANLHASFGHAILSLPGCDIYLLRTFPRIERTLLEGSCAFVALSMKDAPAVIFNGKEVKSCLQFARGPIEYRLVEREPGYYAVLIFSSRMENRGWPETSREFLTIPITSNLELRLRELIIRAFRTASQEPYSNITAAVGLAESLLIALDSAFSGYFSTKSSKENIHECLRTLRIVDDLVDSSSSHPIYSGELAARVGVSVRTLNNRIVKTNGMSLHRYIKLRRLWMVRQQLLMGDPDLQIKEVAIASGFWHLGDFAAAYFSQFGELPSLTQVRSRV
ncbi:MAG: AraC family transcriptional regulator [Bradyrhizobium sp.]|nr:AraC family transcriptional regulator [Bradyrhizobium sp.]